MRSAVLLGYLPLALAVPAVRRDPAPLLTPRDVNSLIADKYIVKFNDGVNAASVDEAITSLVSGADHVYTKALRGFSGTLSADELQLLRAHPDVGPDPSLRLKSVRLT
jgi:hypothetical protein